MTTARRSVSFILCAAVVVGAAGKYASGSETTPVSDLIFSHPLHVSEQGIECVTCHSGVASSAATMDRNLPPMDVCADCHDVEDDKNCGQCHRNPDDPSAAIEAGLEVKFNHQRHLDNKLACAACHVPQGVKTSAPFDPTVPDKPLCMACHDGIRAAWDCNLCHASETTLADIHPVGWRHQHAEQATLKPTWCQTCHQNEVYCIACHRGDNQTGGIHDLNYGFTHGLDAQGKESDCTRCHDRQAFCNDCHLRENRMPLAHSSQNWRSEHGREARMDVENCAACHQVDDPTCARAGCHRDSDGLRGTDPRIHSADPNRFESPGAWHNDNGYFCFDCHTSTGRPGVGFCGYCHGDAD